MAHFQAQIQSPIQTSPSIRSHGRGRSMATVASLTLVALVLAACADMSDTQRRTATGAGIGSAVGAVIGGSQAGGKGVRNGALIGGAVAGLGTYIWSSRMEAQKRAMEESTQGTGVQVTQTKENLLQLDIPSDISFDVNKADVRPDFRPILDRFAQTLVQNPAATVQIIGHTDSTGNDSINNPLSINRAASTRDYLVALRTFMKKAVDDGVDVSAASKAFNARPESARFLQLRHGPDLMPGNASWTYIEVERE